MKLKSFFLGIFSAFILINTGVLAQTGKVKTGTKITYAASDPSASVSLPVVITIPKTGGLVLDYTVKQPQKSFNGKISVTKQGLENANSISWGDLSPDQNTTLSDNETAFCFSRTFYSQLVKSKSAAYNKVTYSLQTSSNDSKIKVGTKTLDALYIIGTNGTKYWILSDPNYPILLKVSGNTVGPDLVVKEVSGL